MRRTVRLDLQPTAEQALLLEETTSQFTQVFNAVCAFGWEHGERDSIRLHHATYYPLKAKLPELVSDHHVQARVKAAEALRSALSLRSRGRTVSCPSSARCPPRFNLNTFKLDWSSRTARLSTTSGRISVRFSVPGHAGRFVGLPTATADLLFRGGRWRLHVVVEVPGPEVMPTDEVVGVDLGLAQPAVTSNGRFLGCRRWREVESRRFKLKRALQRRGTKSAKRHLQKLRGRQARFRRDCDHVVSKQVVLAAQPGATIVVEELKELRGRVKVRRGAQSRRVHGWSFAQLRSFIEYKAEERGCTVVGVDPRHTSQACSRCGHVARTNRRSRAVFKCGECGYELHADLNAARNIAARYRAERSKTLLGGPTVNRPLVGSEPQLSFTCKPSPSGDDR